MRKERWRRQPGAAAAVQYGGGSAEKMMVTARVVLGLFWR